MERICFTFEILPGRQSEYETRHRAVWPELVEALRAAGVTNYSLFRRGRLVIAYAECEPDGAVAFGKVGRTEVNQRWSEWFGDVLGQVTDTSGRLNTMHLMWHMD